MMLDVKLAPGAILRAAIIPAADSWLLNLYSKHGLAILDRLAVFDIDLHDLAAYFGLDLIHQLHRFDNADDRVRPYVIAHFNKRLRGR